MLEIINREVFIITEARKLKAVDDAVDLLYLLNLHEVCSEIPLILQLTNYHLLYDRSSLHRMKVASVTRMVHHLVATIPEFGDVTTRILLKHELTTRVEDLPLLQLNDVILQHD